MLIKHVSFNMCELLHNIANWLRTNKDEVEEFAAQSRAPNLCNASDGISTKFRMKLKLFEMFNYERFEFLKCQE